MTIRIRLIGGALCALLFFASCAPAPKTPAPANLAASTPTEPSSGTGPLANPAPASGLWIDPAVPPALRQAADALGLTPAPDASTAALAIEVAQPVSGDPGMSTWVYALVAPFPTVVDDVSSYELRSAWNGESGPNFKGRPLLLDESTLAAFTTLWGAPATGAVKVLPAEELLDAAWAAMPSWGIVPFEDLSPRWKVLSVDGQSPVRKDFDVARYALLAGYRVRGTSASLLTLAPTNRDPEKMTTVIMTGVTAMVRATAKIMEVKGILYPGRDIRDWMREADIAHVSNEIPFYSGCAFPNPSQRALVFCSSPRYIDLLTDIGTDVIELTGNHFGDYGEDAMMQTLAIYKEKGLPYYGGGKDLEDARKPLLLEDHGNKIAFVGCNPVDVDNFETARENHAGANPCNMEFQAGQIRELKDQGYLVISTFQYYEYYSPEARPWQQKDFELMADSGASIVSGSQAHFAQVMEFRDGSFIHYGLGNLFFDQMGDIPRVPGIRRVFLDRHVIYDGKYISTELLTAMMEDHARPRPMTLSERVPFLQDYFTYSGWLPEAGTPVALPVPTMTLTPMVLPGSPVTPTATP
jgi:poly-gamma-glutamate synthesis protein (capsule biosynthesis protein)